VKRSHPEGGSDMTQGSGWSPTAFGGIEALARALRTGRCTAQEITAAYLERIESLDPKLGAFTHVARASALATAHAIDLMLANGTDLGPLMGVPIAVKDLYSVAAMPTTAGSKIDVQDLVQPEGPFIGRLRRAGCVILGKTKTTEFAAGTINLIHKPPRNPWSVQVPLMPGGSSSGSAVAMAADLCALSLGSDTGGSVRQPAALCGTFGYKCTVGMWPVDGVFPLSATLDSLGLFTRSAVDAGVAYCVLQGTAIPRAVNLRGLRLGKPRQRFFDDLQPEVEAVTSRALELLQGAGVEIVPFDLPEVSESDEAFSRLVPTELAAFLGTERIRNGAERLDPVVRARLESAGSVSAVDYIRLLARHHENVRNVANRLAKLDGWVTPTCPLLPVPVGDCNTVDTAVAWNKRSLRNTQPVNYLGQCAVTLPLAVGLGALPVGLQIVCAPNEDARLLSIAIAVESVLGAGARRPNLSAIGAAAE